MVSGRRVVNGRKAAIARSVPVALTQYNQSGPPEYADDMGSPPEMSGGGGGGGDDIPF